MADSIKCPNCGGNLVFNADLQLMVCEYCMGRFSAEELKNTIVPQAPSDSDAGDRIHQTGAEEHIRKSLGDEGVKFICNSCGAEVVADKNTSATFCAFCGSPAIISQRMTDEFSPDFILPFKYGKDEAIKKFYKWCKGGRWTPFDFVSDKNIQKLTGLYVPFWLYDVDGDIDVIGEGVEESSVTIGNTTTVTTSYYNARRRMKLFWERIPLDGAKRIDDQLMEAIEPFDFKEIQPFDPAYMQGFFAERYDLTGDDMKERLIDRVKHYITEELTPSYKRYNKGFTPKQDNTVLYEPKMKYAMLPVWFLHYKYNGQDYHFCMNGQTGEVAGVPPVSRLKRIVLFFIILIIAAAITRFFVGLYLGGFVG
ncbi:MAG: hypothetical protein J5379_05310 [Clostridiales bacterium]|nr:hypothetical protein [Clostridiales bacterium]